MFPEGFCSQQALFITTRAVPQNCVNFFVTFKFVICQHFGLSPSLNLGVALYLLYAEVFFSCLLVNSEMRRESINI